MPLDTSPMSTDEAREQLARLDLSQQGLARMIRKNPSTVRRWLDPDHPLDVPREVQLLLRLLSPAMVRRLVEADEAK